VKTVHGKYMILYTCFVCDSISLMPLSLSCLVLGMAHGHVASATVVGLVLKD